jgi:crotonobetainyl-CoA:carnitine CoA-transferase CaiB-like acyl-CoA transferase
VRALEGCAVPCGPINGLGDVFADPQVRARELRITMDYPGVGPIPLVASPMRLSDTPVDYRLPPPSLGAHTEEVLLDLLGMSPQAVRALRERGVV